MAVETLSINERVKELPVLPASFVEISAVDVKNDTIYVLKKTAGDPLFMSWHREARIAGYQLKIAIAGLDEISRFRDAGLRVDNSVDDEQKFKLRAIDIITKAAAYKCSDIHFMLRGSFAEIQFTINGELKVFEKVTQDEGENITRSIFQGLSNVRLSFKPLEYQDAQISGDDLPSITGLTSVRIVRGPSYPSDKGGAFMTLRLQYGNSKSNFSADLPTLEYPRQPEGKLQLSQMGYSEDQVEKLLRLFDAPNGLIIFTGPTGSGKTTAMYECLQETARSKSYRRLVTAEDPVEYPMPWAVQLAVTDGKNDKEKGEAFAERIRTMLRMAPKLILLGELRGPEVSCAAIEAALTGHLVITTLHVTDPFLAVERLEMMDPVRLNRSVFCDHKIVRGIIGQRLLPKLCPHCSIPLSENKGLLPSTKVEAMESWGPIDQVRLKGPGCNHCRMAGSTGRFAVAEIIVTDQALMSDYIRHGSDIARKNYRAKDDSNRSMLETAMQHVLAGEVDPRSVEDEVDLIVKKGHE